MRPRKVSTWREQLPPPFDQPRPTVKRRGSAAQLEAPVTNEDEPMTLTQSDRRKRSNSTPGAVGQADRKVCWLRYINAQNARIRKEKTEVAIEKLRSLRKSSARRTSTTTTEISKAGSTNASVSELDRQYSYLSAEEPSVSELSALAAECFQPMEQAKVIITEFSPNGLHVSEYTLEEVLASNCILQPGDFGSRIRWIYVEYHKMGTFWGSDYRFAQWGTDPELFEKSPISLLQTRLAELDRDAGRSPLEDDEIPEYKRIGKYYREAPGCPEYLGLRVNSSKWLKSESYDLLLGHLAGRPFISQHVQTSGNNDLEYGLSYLNAINCIRDSTYVTKPGLRQVHNVANEEGVYVYGSWDDTVERVEFWRENTLLSCGSPRFYKVVADRLRRTGDVLRQHADCALLYYTLARVSIENDEMMQDAPERALNKVFMRLKGNRNTDRSHVELIFSLQQAVLDGLEYLEENKRELPIWGIPPFESPSQEGRFHPDYAPLPHIRNLIQEEMDLIQQDFDKIIDHWRRLRDKVDRYLDVLLQFRVLDQQELAVSQSHVAAQQQHLAVTEARNAGVQSRSVIVFTAITIIFLPLSFFTSYFGMNVTDIISTRHSSRYFWLIAGPISGTIVITIFVVIRCLISRNDTIFDEEKAFASGEVMKREVTWWERHRLHRVKMKRN